ncbi:peptide chain release factor N(5)-glutamine methyltransferase, partial [Patescibacteria group bacterium]|nr:peptide chain release factor N(5)-glutamine methyltransferase [Patescibacteria group bacterium]
ACLIPRPETEVLVEHAIALLKEDERLRQPNTIVIDIGTGSGAIALSIAHALPDRSVIATDISPAARRMAKKNAVQLGVADRVSIQKADLLPEKLLITSQTILAKAGIYGPKTDIVDPLLQGDGKRYLFLANLPYIPTRRWKTLPLSIRRFEPRNAFDGGPDGLALYRSLFLQIKKTGIDTHWTMLAEIDPGQASALSRAVHASFKNAAVTFHRDLGQNIRVAEITVQPHAAPLARQVTSARG